MAPLDCFESSVERCSEWIVGHSERVVFESGVAVNCAGHRNRATPPPRRAFTAYPIDRYLMTLEKLERAYDEFRQQSEAVRSYL